MKSSHIATGLTYDEANSELKPRSNLQIKNEIQIIKEDVIWPHLRAHHRSYTTFVISCLWVVVPFYLKGFMQWVALFCGPVGFACESSLLIREMIKEKSHDLNICDAKRRDYSSTVPNQLNNALPGFVTRQISHLRMDQTASILNTVFSIGLTISLMVSGCLASHHEEMFSYYWVCVFISAAIVTSAGTIMVAHYTQK